MATKVHVICNIEYLTAKFIIYLFILSSIELRFSSANGAGPFAADVMFIYIFTCLLYTSDAADE